MAKAKSKKEIVPQEVREVSIYDTVAQGYTVASKYFAEYRLIPNIFDGMKPVYRRIVISAYEICPKDFIKTATLCGHVLGKYHPHSLPSISDAIAELVHANILIGDGEFGSKYLDGTVAVHASERYTEVKLNPEYTKIFDKILKYVPKVDGELDNKEYKYVPLPLPYMCNKGGFGLGPGLSINTPAFTMKSMIDAYLKDDPTLLKSTYGYALIDKNNSLNRTWLNGGGSIYYALKVGKLNLDGIQGAFIQGSAEIFNLPKMKDPWNTILKWKKKGWVTINEIGKGESKVFVGRNKGVTQIDQNDIYNKLYECSVYRQMVVMKAICPDGIVHPIGLKIWLDKIFNNFISLLQQYKDERIKFIEYKIRVMKDFEVIKNYIIEHMKDTKMTTEMIAKNLNKDLKIVKEIDSYSVSKLRNTDSKKELKRLEKLLDDIKKYDPMTEAVEFINKVDFIENSVVDVKDVKTEFADSHSEIIDDESDDIFNDELESDEDTDDEIENDEDEE